MPVPACQGGGSVQAAVALDPFALSRLRRVQADAVTIGATPGGARPTGRFQPVAVVEARDLKRTYRTSTGIFRRRSLEVEAVRGVSFEIGEGELFGLLGPNRKG